MRPWALLPPVYSVFTAAGLWLVYFMAVDDEKVTPLSSHGWRGNGSLYPPYISVAGNFPPVSCIFSEVMNLAAFGGFVIVFFRFLAVKERMEASWLNVCSLVFFSLGCFGMTLVGNFQLFTQEGIHNLGAFLTFGLGVAFCWLQAVITLKVGLVVVATLRFLLAASVTLSFLFYNVLMPCGLHMHAARCQWALVSFFLLFISSFAVEFRHQTLRVSCSNASKQRRSRSENSDFFLGSPHFNTHTHTTSQ